MRQVFRWMASLSVTALALVLALSPLFSGRSAQAQSTTTTPTVTLFGSLFNFDIYNDTGQVTHGFEIELDGSVNPPTNFFPDRYGFPTVTPFAGGYYVRYESPWDATNQQFTEGTPMQVGPITRTTAEPCIPFQTTLALNPAPCDHNGVRFASISDTPSNVVYRWLIADPQNPGALIPYATPVAIPQPIVTVTPPPQPSQPPVVVFQIQLPPPPPPRIVPPAPQFGEAMWVKVYKTEIAREVGLDELVTGGAIVPQDDTQAETPWKLLQFNPHSANSGTLRSQAPLITGSHAVVRRYEHYKYTGQYDPLTHQAICGGDGLCTAPLDGELGDYIGAQMAAANVGVPSITVTKVGVGTVTGASGKINCGSACTTSVAAGTVVTLTANPGGSAFTGWSGACSGTQLICNVAVNDAVNVTATFTPQFTLSIGRGGSGTVVSDGPGINCGSACSAKYAQGATVSLTAAPATGLHFVNWTGACSGTAPTCNVTITQNTQVQANFAK